MTLLHHSHLNLNISRAFWSQIQLPWRFNLKSSNLNLFQSAQNPISNLGFLLEKKTKKSQSFCHCSSVSSAHQETQEAIAATDDDDGGLDGKYGSEEGQFGNLVRGHGWQVRRMVEEDDEMRSVAHIQAQAFHEPVFLFNDVFFQFFKAEVLSGLLYRLKNSPADRYACLVAEPITSEDPEDRRLVGVVDVTVFRDKAVLEHLRGAHEYLYVSGIAVLRSFRRKKVASVLLEGCETLGVVWGYEYLALRAYEDDLGARKLYANAGYRIVSRDPPWTSWVGKRRRVLMIKQCKVA